MTFFFYKLCFKLDLSNLTFESLCGFSQDISAKKYILAVFWLFEAFQLHINGKV